ncbi:hypothetical protein KM043_012192 [Ampulex compressa]|nr:hypothetical protein KM043_012192 [Ampulex compressa]
MMEYVEEVAKKILSNGSLDRLPKEWLEALEALNNEELNDFVVKKITKQHWPETLKIFVQKCVNLNVLPAIDVLPVVSQTRKLPTNFTIGLSNKKQHEILQLAGLVHSQCEPLGVGVIVDVGAGLGYVCQILHHLYGYQVLGLERSEANVNRARDRQKKFYPDSLKHVKQPFLRLACQEPADRWHNMSTIDHHQHSFHVLARAVFQLYADTSGFLLKKKFQKATRKNQCESFETYIKDSLSRYTLEPINRTNAVKSEHFDNALHVSKITQLWQRYRVKLRNAEYYTALQLVLQAPAESLLLQDRLSWMEEQGLKAFISTVTNRNLSPRCYAIVSQKKFVNKAP